MCIRDRTRAKTLREPTDDAKRIYEVASSRLERVRGRNHRIRLLGISVSKLEPATAPRQMTLFGSEARDERLSRAQDLVEGRFGKGSLRRLSVLDSEPLEREI